MCYSGTCIYENNYGDCEVQTFINDYVRYILNQDICAVGGFVQNRYDITEKERSDAQMEVKRLQKIMNNRVYFAEREELELKIETIKALKGEKEL